MADNIKVKVVNRNNVEMFEKSISNKTTVEDLKKMLIKENDRLSKYSQQVYNV